VKSSVLCNNTKGCVNLFSFVYNYTDLASEKDDDQSETDTPKETGYLGDVDTSSSGSSEAQSSDSDDDISRTSKKGDV